MHHSAVQLISGRVEISDVDLGGKNLHQGQAMGHDLLTDTEKERIYLSIFFDCHKNCIKTTKYTKTEQLLQLGNKSDCFQNKQPCPCQVKTSQRL